MWLQLAEQPGPPRQRLRPGQPWLPLLSHRFLVTEAAQARWHPQAPRPLILAQARQLLRWRMTERSLQQMRLQVRHLSLDVSR